MISIEQTAIHEAAHAAIAILLDRRVHSASITETIETNGTCWYGDTETGAGDATPSNAWGDATPSNAWCDVLCSLAGEIAEELAGSPASSYEQLSKPTGATRPTERNGFSLSDARWVWRHIRKRLSRFTARKQRAVFDLAYQRVRALLSEPAVWRGVQAVATLLIDDLRKQKEQRERQRARFVHGGFLATNRLDGARITAAFRRASGASFRARWQKTGKAQLMELPEGWR